VSPHRRNSGAGERIIRLDARRSTLAAIQGQVAPDFLDRERSASDAGYRGGSDGKRLQRALKKLQLRRWFDGKRHSVKLDKDALDLPLQPGDEIKW
jgi:hypothetical protein